MLIALWIVVTRMLIIFAVLAVLFLAIILLNKLVGLKAKEQKEDKQ